jgi:hypothetical protein
MHVLIDRRKNFKRVWPYAMDVERPDMKRRMVHHDQKNLADTFIPVVRIHLFMLELDVVVTRDRHAI